MSTYSFLVNLVKSQTKFKFDKITLESLISFYYVALNIWECFLYVKGIQHVLKAGNVISTCSSAKIITCIYIYTHNCLIVDHQHFKKVFFSEIRYYAYVFAEHWIGTFHKVESNKVTLYVLIDVLSNFLHDLRTVYLKINIWKMFG